MRSNCCEGTNADYAGNTRQPIKCGGLYTASRRRIVHYGGSNIWDRLIIHEVFAGQSLKQREEAKLIQGMKHLSHIHSSTL